MLRMRFRGDDFAKVARDYGVAADRARPIIAQALTHTAKKARTAVKRTLSRETGIKSGEVSRELRVQYASARSLDAAVVGRGRYRGLRAFGAKQNRKGVRARPWRQGRTFEGAFIVPSLNRQAFVRADAGGKRIRALYGPAVPTELIRGGSLREVEKVMDESLAERALHEMARELRR